MIHVQQITLFKKTSAKKKCSFLQVLENCQNIFKQVRESAELAAEEQLEETTDRQLEEIDEQMRAWSRVGAFNFF